MCPQPINGHCLCNITDHSRALAAALNKELDECRWVIPQARVRTPAGTLAGNLPHGTFVAASGRRTAARQTGMALARRSLPGMPSAARFSSLWTAGRVSGFGPSTLMCPIPVTHTHTRRASSLAATLNKELDECRWVIPQARVRTPAGTLAGTLPHGTFVAASGRRTAARQTGMALARRSLPGMPSAARFSSLWTAGRVSGFGPSTLMCPIPVTHTHTRRASSLAATLNKELDECRWVIPQARVRTPAGTLAGTLPHGTFVAASGRRTAARQTGMALARRSLPGMPSAARFSSLWTAGRVSGFGPSTLMCPIPVKHTHTTPRR